MLRNDTYMADFTTRARDSKAARSPDQEHPPSCDCPPCKRYKEIKRAGLCVTFAGHFPTARRKTQVGKNFTPSGLVFCEMEAGGAEHRDALAAKPFVAAAYVSVGGSGVHVVNAVDPIPKTAAQYEDAWRAVCTALGVDADAAVKLDKGAKDVTRWAFAAYDPDAYLADGALQPYRWQDGMDRVRHAPPGTRNTTLNAEAYRQAVRGKPLDETAAAGLEAGLDPDEVAKTIASAAEAGRAERGRVDGEITAPKDIAAAVAKAHWGSRDFSGLLVRERGDRLMVVTYDKKPSQSNPVGGRDATAYVVDKKTGIWTHDVTLLREWLTQIAWLVVREALDTLESRDAYHAFKEAKRLKENSVNEAIRRIPDVQRGVSRDERVVEAHKRDLDPWGYLGTPSGVVSLASAEVLPPEKGRLHRVTRSTNVELPDPDDPVHWGVEALMGHYDPEVEKYVWKWFARSLWGLPAQEFLLFVGQAKYGHEGKTTLKESILRALGGYGGSFSESMLWPRHEAGPTPELQPPTEKRLLISEECANWKIEAERFKLLTGGSSASIQVEPKFEAQQTLPVTASIVLMANEPPRNLPKDDALMKRLRYIELKRIRRVNPELRDLHKTDPTFSSHVLRRLIQEAATLAPDTAAGGLRPRDLDIYAYPHIESVTRAKIAELLGKLHLWVQRAVMRGDGNLGRQTLWEAWATVHGADPKAERIAGETQDTLREDIFQLYGQQSMPVKERGSHKTVRGWKGLVLRDIALCSQCEQPTPPAELQDVDGRGTTCEGCREVDDDAPPGAATGEGAGSQGGLGGMPRPDGQPHIELLADVVTPRRRYFEGAVKFIDQGGADQAVFPDTEHTRMARDHEARAWAAVEGRDPSEYEAHQEGLMAAARERANRAHGLEGLVLHGRHRDQWARAAGRLARLEAALRLTAATVVTPAGLRALGCRDVRVLRGLVDELALGDIPADEESFSSFTRALQQGLRDAEQLGTGWADALRAATVPGESRA